MLITVILMACSACGNAESTREPLSFPSELFSIQAENDEDIECQILLDESYVGILENGDAKTPTLKLLGTIPAICSSLSVRIDPPTITST